MKDQSVAVVIMEGPAGTAPFSDIHRELDSDKMGRVG
jgi:hypothetical protein